MLWIQQELEYDYALSKNWINVLNISRTHQNSSNQAKLI